jgi:hypothetical protein
LTQAHIDSFIKTLVMPAAIFVGTFIASGGCKTGGISFFGLSLSDELG